VLANQSPDNPVLLISLLNFGRIISGITAMNPFGYIFPDSPVVERAFFNARTNARGFKRRGNFAGKEGK